MFEIIEGMSGNHIDGSTINVRSDEAYGDGALNNATMVVIGNDIRKVTNVDNMALTVEKGFYSDENAPVYPIGYQVAIKASRETWDPKKCVMVTEYLDRYEMPLTCVMPDRRHSNSRSSDRLIFECALNEKDGDSTLNRLYNKFELEIYWKKSCTNNLIESADKIYGGTTFALAGSIKDLSLSLDRVIGGAEEEEKGEEDLSEKFVPREEYEALLERLKELEEREPCCEDASRSDVEDLIDDIGD
jgi:hypothetical protein